MSKFLLSCLWDFKTFLLIDNITNFLLRRVSHHPNIIPVSADAVSRNNRLITISTHIIVFVRITNPASTEVQTSSTTESHFSVSCSSQTSTSDVTQFSSSTVSHSSISTSLSTSLRTTSQDGAALAWEVEGGGGR